DRKDRKPPTVAQLVANELSMIARVLKYDAQQLSALTSNGPLGTALTTEQTTIQTQEEAIRKARKALVADIAAGPSKNADAPTQAASIAAAENAILEARAAAAQAAVSDIPGLTGNQPTALAQLLTGGGPGPGFGFGPGR